MKLGLGWVSPPQPGEDITEGVTLSLPTDPVQPPATVAQAVEAASVVEPAVQPQPPPVSGRRRRSAGSAAPPPVPPVIEQICAPSPQEVQAMSGNLPTFGASSFNSGTPTDLGLSERLDKVGKMVADMGNMLDANYKATNAALVKLDEAAKTQRMLMAAAHHMYVSSQALLQQLANQKIDPPSDLTNFIKLMAYFAGIPQ
jgi:hypothetical protein